MRSSDCSASQTARALALHVRTLQRRLALEGLTFEAIKDEVRKEMAEEMLRDPSLSITDIALALHYENVPSLTRSCRRWFGAAPSSLRRRATTELS
jgi:AraC-like DNA-binding protein